MTFIRANHFIQCFHENVIVKKHFLSVWQKYHELSDGSIYSYRLRFKIINVTLIYQYFQTQKFFLLFYSHTHCSLDAFESKCHQKMKFHHKQTFKPLQRLTFCKYWLREETLCAWYIFLSCNGFLHIIS
jgi:hypothetical protein